MLDVNNEERKRYESFANLHAHWTSSLTKNKERETTKTFERLREGNNGIVGLLDDQIEGENVQNDALGEQQLHFDLLEWRWETWGTLQSAGSGLRFCWISIKCWAIISAFRKLSSTFAAKKQQPAAMIYESLFRVTPTNWSWEWYDWML